MKDWNGYVKRMNAAIEEKLFFTKRINLNDYDLIVDFGCGNGELLRKIKLMGYEPNLLGFDTSQEMISSAIDLSLVFNDIFYVLELKQLKSRIKEYEKVLVIFSSVWHEIDSSLYKEIFNKIFTVADTVVIRDMYYSDFGLKNGGAIDSYFREKLVNHISKNMLDEYENIWGEVEYFNWNFYHLMLKYTYVDNWETEVQEFYFGTPWANIITNSLEEGYRIIYEKTYTLPYKKAQVLTDFGYNLTEPTHRNLILRRK